jgi:PAS domain S-box-containing protein
MRMKLKLNRLGTARISRHRSACSAQLDGDFAQRLMDTAQVIIKVLDLQGRIVRFNRSMEETSGYGLAEMRGRDWFATFVPEHERERMKALFMRLVQGQAMGAFSGVIRTKSGALRAIDWRATALT